MYSIIEITNAMTVGDCSLDFCGLILEHAQRQIPGFWVLPFQTIHHDGRCYFSVGIADCVAGHNYNAVIDACFHGASRVLSRRHCGQIKVFYISWKR